MVHVVLQPVLPGEPFPTHPARMVFLARVGPAVLSQVALGGEALAADVTLMVSLLAVGQSVLFQ
jgi:hypothetical protein